MTTVEIISLVLGSSLALRVVDHFLTRRISRNNAEKVRIENIDLAGDTWQNVVDRLEKRIEKLLDQLNGLQDENMALKEEIYKVREELASFKNIQKKVERYEKQIGKLEERIAHYEQLLTANGIEF